MVYQVAGYAFFSRQQVLELRDAGTDFDGFTRETANPAQTPTSARILEEA